MTDPLEFGPGIPDDELYDVDHLVDAAHDRDVQLWEAYVRRAVACHFHLRIYIGGEGHSHDLCADFQALGGLGGSHTPGDAVKGNSVSVEAKCGSGKQR